MADSIYKLSLGLLILMLLYFNLNYMMWGVIGVVFVEGLTNWRIPLIFSKSNKPLANNSCEATMGTELPVQITLEAERVWRLIMALFLLISYVMYFELLWFFPWFMGFAMVGAGISGICPMIFLLKWLGLK